MSDNSPVEHMVSMLRRLEQMVEEKSLEPAFYYKALIIAANEYFKVNQSGEALNLLGTIPAEYFLADIDFQMAADPMYADIVCILSEAIIKGGFVHLGFSEDEQKVMGKA